MFSYFTQDAGRRAIFEARYRRPFPWFELIDIAGLEPLAYEMGRRMSMMPLTGDLRKVCAHAGSLMNFDRPDPKRLKVDDSVEPLSWIVRRCGLDTNGAAYITDGTDQSVAHVLIRDLVAFDDLLWSWDSVLIDSNGDWIVIATHCTLAGHLRLHAGPSSR